MAEMVLTAATWLVVIAWPVLLVVLAVVLLQRQRLLAAATVPDADDHFARARKEYEQQLAKIAASLSACRERISLHVEPVRYRIQILSDLTEALGRAEQQTLQQVPRGTTRSSDRGYLSAIVAMKNAESFRSLLAVANSLIAAEQDLLEKLEAEEGGV